MHILIIGGGVVGLSCAYSLQQAGHRISLLDEQAAGSEASCSFGNAGMIVPSHFVPLAAPGVVQKGLKWLFRSDSPLYIRPGLDPALMSWLMRFTRAASREQVARSAPLLYQLGMQSRELYPHWCRELGVELGCRGLNMLYKTPECEREERETAEQAAQLGMPVKVLDAAQVAAMEQQLKVEVRGGVHYEMDAHLHPAHLMRALRRQLRQAGVEFLHETRVSALRLRQGKLAAVETSKGNFSADAYLLAAGAWSGRLAAGLSLSLPMQAGKGYSLTLSSPPAQLHIPSILCEAKVAATPMGAHLRFGGTMEIGGLSLKVSKKRVRGLIRSISAYFPQMKPEVFANVPVWAGLRPCSPDGLPYIGTTRQADNLLLATGHAMMGLSLAPVTAMLITQLIAGEQPECDMQLLSPDRFMPRH